MTDYVVRCRKCGKIEPTTDGEEGTFSLVSGDRVIPSLFICPECDLTPVAKAKLAARDADKILAKIAKYGTSFLSLRENALAASNKWAQVADAARPPTTDLREVDPKNDIDLAALGLL